MNNQIENIKKYILLLKEDIKNDELLEFNIEEAIDRILNHINRKELPMQLERVTAKAIVNIYKKVENEKENDGEQQKEISTISDHGQSISFSEKTKTYMLNSSDDDLFYGFLGQINKFVKAKVVGENEYSKQLQESNKE